MLQPYAPTLGRLVGLSTERITQLIGYNKCAPFSRPVACAKAYERGAARRVIFTLTALAGPACASRIGSLERLQSWTLGLMARAVA